jgi:hypothetical protein
LVIPFNARRVFEGEDDAVFEFLGIEVEMFKDLRDEAVFLFHHRKKEVDFVEGLMFHIEGEVVCGLQGFAEFVSEDVVVHKE